jgi:hypothetical protein
LEGREAFAVWPRKKVIKQSVILYQDIAHEKKIDMLFIRVAYSSISTSNETGTEQAEPRSATETFSKETPAEELSAKEDVLIIWGKILKNVIIRLPNAVSHYGDDILGLCFCRRRVSKFIDTSCPQCTTIDFQILVIGLLKPRGCRIGAHGRYTISDYTFYLSGKMILAL